MAPVIDLDGKRTGLDGKQRPAHPTAINDETQDAATEAEPPVRSDRKTEAVRKMLLSLHSYAEAGIADIDPAEVKADELTREIAAFPAAIRKLNKFVKAVAAGG